MNFGFPQKGVNSQRKETNRSDDMCGGVVKHYSADAPKVIESRELIFFFCRFLASAQADDAHLNKRQEFCFSAELSSDDAVCITCVTRNGRATEKQETRREMSFMKELEKLLRGQGVSELNGYYHFVSGLPRFFGSSLEAKYKSGEQIQIYDNQRNLLSADTVRELCRLFPHLLKRNAAILGVGYRLESGGCIFKNAKGEQYGYFTNYNV